MFCFFFSSRRRHTRYWRDWSSDVCSSDLDGERPAIPGLAVAVAGVPLDGSPAVGGRERRKVAQERGAGRRDRREIGRAAWGGKEENSGGAGSLKKKKKVHKLYNIPV